MGEKERKFIRNDDFDDYDDEDELELRGVNNYESPKNKVREKKKESLRDRTYKNINYINTFSKIYLQITLVVAIIVVVVGFFMAILAGSFIIFLFFVLIAALCYLNVFFITLFINWCALLLENIAEINNKTK